MATTETAQQLIHRLSSTKPLLTTLRGIAKDIGKNQAMADDLWASGDTRSRLVALLCLDLKASTPQTIDRMIADIEHSSADDRVQLCDWLISNVIAKKSALKSEALNWRTDPSAIKRRVFWTLKARSRSLDEHEHNEQLLDAIEQDMAGEDDMVQWAMNWCAAQIGIADETLRERCIQLGERLGLYIDYPVSKGCTSPYLPLWIRTIVDRNEAAAG